jgi:hypothetical protein
MACLSTQIAELNVELAKYKKQLADLEAELQTAKEAEPRDKEEIDKIEARIERKEDAISVKEVLLTRTLEAAQAQPGGIYSLPSASFHLLLYIYIYILYCDHFNFCTTTLFSFSI